MASKIDDDRTAFERAIDWCNQLFFVAMPIVVLCVLWPMLTRIDKRTAEIERRVEQQADVIDEIVNKIIGDKKWREVQNR